MPDIRDKKHRINSTIVVIVSFIIALGIFFFQKGRFGDEIAAIAALITGIFINVLYQYSYLRHLEHNMTRVNAMTQVWLGVIIMASGFVTIILNTVFNVEFSTAVIWMAGITLVILFLSIKHFDRYLEEKIQNL